MGTTYPIKAQVRLHGKMTRGEKITGPSLPQGTSASLSIAHVGGVLTPVFLFRRANEAKKIHTCIVCTGQASQQLSIMVPRSQPRRGVWASSCPKLHSARGIEARDTFSLCITGTPPLIFFSFCLGRDCRLGDMVQIPVLRSICLLRSLATKAQRGVVNKTQQAQV